MEPILDLGSCQVIAEGLDHPEGIAVGPDGHVYAGGEAGQIYRVSPDGGGLTELGSTQGFVLGICLDGNGNIYACDTEHRAVMRMTPDGDATIYSAGSAQHPFVNPNYPVFDSDGTLYVSDSGQWGRNDGSLWSIPPGGGPAVLVDDTLTRFPNGLSLDPSDNHLYVALSELPGVARLPVAGGRATGAPEVFVELPGTVPDGLAFDVDGNLYVSCYAPDAILRVSPDRQVSLLIDDWQRVTLASPTNIAFGGPDRSTLFIASLCRWHLTSVEVGVAGSPCHYPRVEWSGDHEPNDRSEHS